jgi:hypothetical protein
MATACLAKPDLTRLVRRQLGSLICDDSGAAAEGTALYWLADPRDLQTIRYVGQTKSPRRRYLQHMSTARLWLPDERPWWIASPKLRPLYEWIRELHREDLRLPAMIVSAWVPTTEQARIAERTRILECLEQHLPLLNFERETLGRQIPLL